LRRSNVHCSNQREQRESLDVAWKCIEALKIEREVGNIN